MAVIPLPPERFAEVQQALREMEGPPARQAVVNEAAVAALSESRRLVFRSRAFVVGPVSYRDGQRLQSLMRTLAAAGERGVDGEAEVFAVMEDAVELCHRIVHPRTHRWRPNPFRHASEREVGALLGFFLACRSLSGVRHAE